MQQVFSLAGAVARRRGVALHHGNDPRTRVVDTMHLLEAARSDLGLG